MTLQSISRQTGPNRTGSRSRKPWYVWGEAINNQFSLQLRLPLGFQLNRNQSLHEQSVVQLLQVVLCSACRPGSLRHAGCPASLNSVGNAWEAQTGRSWGFCILCTTPGARKSRVTPAAVLSRPVTRCQNCAVPLHRRLPQIARFCGQRWRHCFSFHLAPLCPPAKESALAATAVANPICWSLDHFLSQPRHLDLWLVQLIVLLAELQAALELNSHGEAWGGAHLSHRSLFILAFQRRWPIDINFIDTQWKMLLDNNNLLSKSPLSYLLLPQELLLSR